MPWLKFFETEGRFPRHAGELPRPAVSYMASQVSVATDTLADYDWAGRTNRYHRAQIRRAFGFREATVGDEDKLATWLAVEVCPVELSLERQREALLARCRAQRIEPPSPGRVERIIASAQESCERQLTGRIVERLSEPSIAQLEALVALDGEGTGLLVELKSDPAASGFPRCCGSSTSSSGLEGSAFLPACSATSPTRSWPRGGHGRPAATHRTYGRRPNESASACSPRCVGPERPR